MDVPAYLSRFPLPFSVPPASEDRALVIVETRPLPTLPRVIASAVAHHPGWHLYVFGTPEVHALLKASCNNYAQVTQVRLSVGEGGMSTKQYSLLLLSPSFWDIVRQEHVLVFQADCVVVRTTPPSALAYDYVGAVCGLLDPRAFVMNGGLSLRRRSAMARAVGLVRAHHPDLLDQPEDVALCSVMRQYPSLFCLPDMQTCNNFAIESLGNPRTAIGIHGTDKGYAPAELVEACLESACLPRETP